MDDPVVAVPDASTQARELLFAIQRWVERADTKASILLAAVTAGLFGLLAAMYQLMDWAVAGGAARGSVEVLLGGAVAFLFAAGVLAGRAVIPRLGPRYEHVPGTFAPGDIVYFGRLRTMPADEIARGLNQAFERSEFTLHFAEQIRANSIVAWEKHRLLRHAMLTAAPAAALSFIAIMAWLAMRLAD